jgi:hypothetical protein
MQNTTAADATLGDQLTNTLGNYYDKFIDVPPIGLGLLVIILGNFACWYD